MRRCACSASSLLESCCAVKKCIDPSCFALLSVRMTSVFFRMTSMCFHLITYALHFGEHTQSIAAENFANIVSAVATIEQRLGDPGQISSGIDALRRRATDAIKV